MNINSCTKIITVECVGFSLIHWDKWEVTPEVRGVSCGLVSFWSLRICVDQITAV